MSGRPQCALTTLAPLRMGGGRFSHVACLAASGPDRMVLHGGILGKACHGDLHILRLRPCRSREPRGEWGGGRGRSVLPFPPPSWLLFPLLYPPALLCFLGNDSMCTGFVDLASRKEEEIRRFR